MYRGSRGSSPSASRSRLTRLFTVSGLTTRPGQTCVIKDSLLSTFGAARTNATRSWNDRLGKAMSLPARVTRCCPTSRYRSPTMNVPDLVLGKSPDIWFIGLSRRPSQDGVGGFGLDVKKEPFGICVCFRAEYRERAGRFRLLPCPISSFPCRPDETAGLGFLHHRLRPTLTAVRTKGEREQGCSKSRQAVIRHSPFRSRGRLPQHRPPCTLLANQPKRAMH